jgi:hypothetical protein
LRFDAQILGHHGRVRRGAIRVGHYRLGWRVRFLGIHDNHPVYRTQRAVAVLARQYNRMNVQLISCL